MRVHIAHFSCYTNITCSHNCTFGHLLLLLIAHMKCIGTLILILWLYFMWWNFTKHATKWRCHKRWKKTRHPNTFDHLAFGEHNIFISFFFRIFSLFLSHSVIFQSFVKRWCAMMAGKRIRLLIEYWTCTCIYRTRWYHHKVMHILWRGVFEHFCACLPLSVRVTAISSEIEYALRIKII